MATPTSTYRLQITPGFTLVDAAELVPYLAELGVGAVYLSPIFSSTPGSEHGYDVVDPTTIDPQRGGEAGWDALVRAAESAHVAIVVDIVPNHLGVAAASENPSWWSVLRDGAASAYAAWYDIDWARGQIVLPVLGEDASAEDFVLTDDELRYHEHRFPLAPGTRGAGDSVDEVLARQHYRLVSWRDGDAHISYRRFFSITSLAGLRVEDPDVFAATHAGLATLLEQPALVGVRVDHPDGLADPTQYLSRLRDLIGDHRWLVAEKIIEPGEVLPAWPIDGTTGYDALREVGGVLIDPDDEPDFTRLYRDLGRDDRDLASHVVEGKRRAADTLLVAEAERVARIIAGDNHDRRNDLVAAMSEVAAHLDVYRSYLPFGADYLTAAADRAKATQPDLAAAIDDLLVAITESGTEAAARFEQFSGAVMAKGVEDTAYYRYNRFIALNEVGGDPAQFGISVTDFHQLQQQRQQAWPRSMTAMATHDTKRGEDIRARLAVLSEIDRPWEDFAAAFQARSRIPDPSFSYLLAQTLVAAGTIERTRMHAYVEKAMREAAVGTSWTDPDPHFEATVHALVDEAYDDPDLRDALARMWVVVEQPGWSNTLAQKVLQLTMPGVPDVYQGTELWDNALVDPDNRRPVNFHDRRARLSMIDHAVAQGDEPPPVDDTGNAKLWVTAQTLRLRREHPEAFRSYQPVLADGPAADHLVGFHRGDAITVATRLPYRLAEAGGWRETTVHLDGTWRDVFSGHTWSGDVLLNELLHHYPVSLLHRS